jgi:hypothetical protein
MAAVLRVHTNHLSEIAGPIELRTRTRGEYRKLYEMRLDAPPREMFRQTVFDHTDWLASTNRTLGPCDDLLEIVKLHRKPVRVTGIDITRDM